jgi:AcrR family transcriptional regulator
MPAKFTELETVARREEILASVAPVFAACGYEGTTVAALEAATGLSRGGIFFHFGSKRDLYLAAIRYCHLRAAPAVRAAAFSGADTSDGMLRIFEMFLDQVTRHPEAHLFLRQVRTNRAAQPDLAAMFREIDAQQYAHYGALCAELQSRGLLNGEVDPEAFARVYGSVVEGLIEYSLEHSREETLDHARRAFDALARGAAPHR